MIIQVLIGLGLAALASVVFAQMSLQAMKSQKNVQLLFDFNNLGTIMQQALQNQTVCTGNLNTTNFQAITFDTTAANLASQSININQLTYPDSSLIIKSAWSPSPGLMVSALRLKNFKQLSLGTSYMAMLHVEVTKNRDITIGALTSSKDISLLLTTTMAVPPIATITACTADSSSGSNNFNGVSPYYSPGSFLWPVPPGVTKVQVEVWGAGGGGGGGGWGVAEGSGGGGGGYAKGIVTLPAGITSVNVTVGGKGTGGNFGGSAYGSAGGASFFGSSYATAYVRADGGSGGPMSAAAGYGYPTSAPGGAGGGGGGPASYLTQFGATGGSSAYSGDLSVAPSYSGAGGASGYLSYGAGGAGCDLGSGSSNGADGSNGAVIITW